MVKQNFIIWLRHKGAWESFLKEYNKPLQEQWRNRLYDNCWNKPTMPNNINPIIYAFEWEETEDGHEYWCRLCEEYADEYLNKL